MASPERRRGRPAGSSGEATRARLLRAAREVFAEKGYAAASTAEIVARAGVSTPVLYHYFGNKAGVFSAATTAVYDDVVSELEAAVADRRSFADCLDAILTASVAMHERDPSMAAFIVSTPEIAQDHSELAGLHTEFRRTEELFRRIVARTGGIDGVGQTESVRVLRMVVWGMTRLSSSLPDGNEFAAAVTAYRAVLLGGALR